MTPSEAGTHARIEALEMRVAYQDDTIEKLNAAITEQWTQIDRLKRTMDELRDRLREAEDRAPAPAGHELPPHY